MWCANRFNIQQLYVLPNLYLCVFYLSENKQMEWISFGALPYRGGKKTCWQLASRCCWTRARPWYASELVSFLVGLRTYKHTSTSGSTKWPLSLKFPHQNPVHTSPLPHTSYDFTTKSFQDGRLKQENLKQHKWPLPVTFCTVKQSAKSQHQNIRY